MYYVDVEYGTYKIKAKICTHSHMTQTEVKSCESYTNLA